MAVRPTRWMIRISLILVIVFGLLGYWLAIQSFQFDVSAVQVEQPADEGAWLDILATLGEEAIQLFLGFAAD